MASKTKDSVSGKEVLRPLGLRTTPNPYGLFPEGALSDAKNAVMRRPGEIQAAPSYTNFTVANVSFNVDEPLRLLMPLNAGHVYTFTHTAGDVWSSGESVAGVPPNAVAFPASVTGASLFSQTRVSATRSRDRMLVNSKRGVLVGDNMQPSNSTERALRWAGLPQPSIFPISFTSPTSAPIPTGVTIGYSSVITREFSDGYVIKSVPSPPIRYNNSTGSSLQLTIQVEWINIGVVKSGDYIELYRTDGLSTSSVDADPGSTFKLCARVQLTATDITNAFIDIIDRQPMFAPFYTTTGRELYTNPYQEGALGANRQPDTCQAIATFKGFTFYGNITERAQATISIPGGLFGSPLSRNAYRRANGVGARLVNGTSTSGSATITAVPVADIVGIVPGQYWFDSSGIFAFGTRVLSVGATSITMTANALSSGAFTDKIITDIAEIDGAIHPVAGGATFAVNSAYETTNNQSVSYNADSTSDGLVTVIETAIVYGSIGGSQNITLRATHGNLYSPTLPEYNVTAQTFSPKATTNLLRWSKDSEPEHVPSDNETQVGTGQIIALATTKDALWIACSDGVYRLSGDGGSWRVDLVAPALVLCGPRCMVNMREIIYAYTNFGFGAITDSGFVPISHSLLRVPLPGPPFSETGDIVLGRNDAEGEVLISPSSAFFSNTYVYNTLTDAFTYISDPANHFTSITAFAWQESPASGVQCTLWGKSESGSAPAYICWNSTAAYLPITVIFHPFYAGEAFTMKQWVDMTFMFINESAGYTMTATCFGSASGVGLITAPLGNEAYATFGVDRRFAMAQKIQPGLQISSITANRVFLYGVRCRYVPLTLQEGVRQ